MIQPLLGIIGIANLCIAFQHYGQVQPWVTGLDTGIALYMFAVVASIEE